MKRLHEILTVPASGPTEIVTALTILAYGIGQVLFPTNRLITWTGFLILIAIGRIAAVVYDHYQLRVYTTLVCIFIWLYLWVWALITPPHSPRLISFFFWFVIECWTLFRIKRTR